MAEIWNSNQYFEKAALYIRTSRDPNRGAWEKPLWYALALEHLARATLTSVHPALNADPQNEGVNLLYAFGYELKGQPRSIPIHAVFARLERICRDFNKPRKEFCDFFIMMRNRELHSSELTFDGFSEGKWLARYYDVCDVLCSFMNRTLEDLLGSDEFDTAGKLTAALHSDKVSIVKKRIAAHSAVFDAKPDDEKVSLQAQQDAIRDWAYGRTRAECPSCGSRAELYGHLESISEPYYEDDQLLVRNVFVASRLECGACGLHLADIDELHIAGVEPRFEQIEHTDLHQYAEPEYYMEYNNE